MSQNCVWEPTNKHEHSTSSFLDLCGEVLFMRSATHFGISDEIIPTYPKTTTLTGQVEGLKLSLI